MAIYAPIKLASGKNLACFTDAENVLASGYLWAKIKKQLAYKPYTLFINLWNKEGMVISTSRTHHWAWLDGLNIMLQ
jgi:hypothetical protein